MADVIRYVNAGSTGGDGTTTALTGANAAYASLSAAFAAEVVDLVTATNTLYFRCFGTTADTTRFDVPTGYTTSTTYSIIVENATGETGGDPSLEAWDTGAYRFEPTSTTNVPLIDFGNADVRNMDGVIFRNIQLGGIFNGAVNQTLVNMDQSPWGGVVTFDKCVIKLGGSCTGSLLTALASQTALTVNKRNCLFILDGYTGSASTRAYTCNSASAVSYGNNNTISGYSAPIINTTGAITLGNNLFTGNTTDTTGTITSIGGNVTNNANFGSMTSTGNGVSKTFTFEASSYKLAAGDTGAAEQGTDLSAATLAVTVDAFGTARAQSTNYDAGYHERVAAGGGSPIIKSSLSLLGVGA